MSAEDLAAIWNALPLEDNAGVFTNGNSPL